MTFEISRTPESTVALVGRFDASQEATASSVLNTLEETTVLDFSSLHYIGSAGLGLLFATQRRLRGGGHGLRIVNMSPRIRDLFETAGFLEIFGIE